MLRTELGEQRVENDRLAQCLLQVVPTASHKQIVQQLGYGYQQTLSAQEDQLAVQAHRLQQAYGQMLVELESEVCDRERELVRARQGMQDLRTAQCLAGLEQRRCAFLQREVDQQSEVVLWLRRKQEELDDYRQISAIYRDELSTATELVDVLRAENNAWEHALAAASGARDPVVSRRLLARASSPALASASPSAVSPRAVAAARGGWTREAPLLSPPVPAPVALALPAPARAQPALALLPATAREA